MLVVRVVLVARRTIDSCALDVLLVIELNRLNDAPTGREQQPAPSEAARDHRDSEGAQYQPLSGIELLADSHLVAPPVRSRRSVRRDRRPYFAVTCRPASSVR